MHDPNEILEITLYHDVLCGWSWLADKRLRLLQEEIPLWIDYRPFPLRLEEMIPSRRERNGEMRALRKVAKEKDGQGIVTDLWKVTDPPRSSLPPLIALEAARIVGGVGSRDRLLQSMRRAAFTAGLNISRDDILIELAEQCRIDVGRFSTALRSAGTRRLVTDAYEDALSHGIEATPAIVVGGEWLLTGARTVEDYRETLERFIDKRGIFVPARVVH